ncbi:hypothetical protein [Actinokineospora guangxiensis]|uniref:hypothetical protein n=1 Tax=Actinokineospora guangxiensis TaxID=1490288 RepID=UPI0036713CAE
MEPALGKPEEVVAIMTGLAAHLLREPAVRPGQVTDLLVIAEAVVDEAIKR